MFMVMCFCGLLCGVISQGYLLLICLWVLLCFRIGCCFALILLGNDLLCGVVASFLDMVGSRALRSGCLDCLLLFGLVVCLCLLRALHCGLCVYRCLLLVVLIGGFWC